MSSKWSLHWVLTLSSEWSLNEFFEWSWSFVIVIKLAQEQTTCRSDTSSCCEFWPSQAVLLDLLNFSDRKCIVSAAAHLRTFWVLDAIPLCTVTFDFNVPVCRGRWKNPGTKGSSFSSGLLCSFRPFLLLAVLPSCLASSLRSLVRIVIFDLKNLSCFYCSLSSMCWSSFDLLWSLHWSFLILP